MLNYYSHSVSREVVSIFQVDLGKEATLPLGLNKQTYICILAIQFYIFIISVLPLCPTVPLPVPSNQRGERLLLPSK